MKNLPYRTLNARKSSKKSAVLILLYPQGNDIHMIFTLRSKKLSNHSGQISFPGGHIEKGEDAAQTALRETQEEIGIDTALVRIIGQLSDLYVPPTNYIITPVIGYMTEKPDYFINSPDEVEEILDIPLGLFLNNDIYSVETWNYQGQALKVPLWKIHDETPLWGATSMIMSEFLILYRQFCNENTN